MKISVQLYSLRNEIGEIGFDAVLEGIAAAGVEQAELIEDLYGLTLAEYKALLDKHGLSASGTHIGLASIENREAALERCGVLGIKNLIVPWLSVEDLTINLENTAARLRSEAAFYREHGITVGYHNHAHEFADGADRIVSLINGAPDLWLEPDIFWLAAAGKAPAVYLDRYAGRLLTMHLKELSKDGVTAPNPFLGGGASDTAACLALARRINLDHVVIEFEGISAPWREYLQKAAAFCKL